MLCVLLGGCYPEFKLEEEQRRSSFFTSKYGFSIFGTCGSGKNIIWDHAFSLKTALIFGSEKNGLDNFWKKNINTFLKIPMYGRADSLNLHASVACTLFEFNRQTR